MLKQKFGECVNHYRAQVKLQKEIIAETEEIVQKNLYEKTDYDVKCHEDKLKIIFKDKRTTLVF